MPGGPRGFGVSDRATDLRMRYGAWWFESRNRHDRAHPRVRHLPAVDRDVTAAARRVRARNDVQLAALGTVQAEEPAPDQRSTEMGPVTTTADAAQDVRLADLALKRSMCTITLDTSRSWAAIRSAEVQLAGLMGISVHRYRLRGRRRPWESRTEHARRRRELVYLNRRDRRRTR